MSIKACSVTLYKGREVVVDADPGSRWYIHRQWNYQILGIRVRILVWVAKDRLQTTGLTFSFPIRSSPDES